MRYKSKKTLKTLALSVLGIGAVVGACAGINALVEKQDTELKTIIPIFEVGGLKTEDGKYEETDGSIYTRQAFECQGLEIELDFDNTIKYQVFYYEDDGDFISSTNVLLGNQDLVVPFNATHARLEITPNWTEMGEDYEDTKNQEIKWYEVAKYSTQMDVKVNKEQINKKLSSNLFIDAYFGKSASEKVGSFTDFEGRNTSEYINIANYSKLYVLGDNMPFAYVIYDENGDSLEIKVIDESLFVDGMMTIDLSEVEGANKFALSYIQGSSYSIFGAE